MSECNKSRGKKNEAEHSHGEHEPHHRRRERSTSHSHGNEKRSSARTSRSPSADLGKPISHEEETRGRKASLGRLSRKTMSKDSDITPASPPTCRFSNLPSIPSCQLMPESRSLSTHSNSPATRSGIETPEEGQPSVLRHPSQSRSPVKRLYALVRKIPEEEHIEEFSIVKTRDDDSSSISTTHSENLSVLIDKTPTRKDMKEIKEIKRPRDSGKDKKSISSDSLNSQRTPKPLRISTADQKAIDQLSIDLRIGHYSVDLSSTDSDVDLNRVFDTEERRQKFAEKVRLCFHFADSKTQSESPRFMMKSNTDIFKVIGTIEDSLSCVDLTFKTSDESPSSYSISKSADRLRSKSTSTSLQPQDLGSSQKHVLPAAIARRKVCHLRREIRRRRTKCKVTRVDKRRAALFQPFSFLSNLSLCLQFEQVLHPQNNKGETLCPRRVSNGALKFD